MVGLPPRMMLNAKLPRRPPESLSVDQLSGGYRAMLALVTDLARRMADLNPGASDPLSVPGVVLIDEIDLHLHQKWQQLVVNSLRQMIPKVQFILSTHKRHRRTTGLRLLDQSEYRRHYASIDEVGSLVFEGDEIERIPPIAELKVTGFVKPLPS